MNLNYELTWIEMANLPEMCVTPSPGGWSFNETCFNNQALLRKRSDSLPTKQEVVASSSHAYSADPEIQALVLRLKDHVEYQYRSDASSLSNGVHLPSPLILTPPRIPPARDGSEDSSEDTVSPGPKRFRSSRMKHPLYYNLQATPKLRALARNAFNLPNTLNLLVDGVRRLIREKWKALVVYYQEDCRLACLEHPWLQMGLSKWCIVALLTEHLVNYAKCVEEAAYDDVRLCTIQADEEYLQMLVTLLDRGAQTDKDTIFIKDCECVGILSFFTSGFLDTTDVQEDSGAGAYDVSSNGSDSESDYEP